MTPDQETHQRERAERLRRERMRRRRQSVAVVAVLVAAAVLGTAFALRPGSSPLAAQPAAASGAATVPTRAPGTGTAAETSRSAETTDGTSTETSRSAEATATPAKETTKAATGIASVKPLKPAPGVKTIVVDKSEQRVTLYKANGTPVDTFRCASGITYPRIGTYKVYGHRKQSWSMYDDTTFYYFTQFVKSDKGNNIGFHSIPQHPDGSLEGKLGKPVSHGCVRLDKAKAKFLYTWAVTGTRVVVKR
jgi:lipoprotein-anchoring transpeptidase ErfK/SrfK